jgi:hypothetical protein
MNFQLIFHDFPQVFPNASAFGTPGSKQSWPSWSSFWRIVNLSGFVVKVPQLPATEATGQVHGKRLEGAWQVLIFFDIIFHGCLNSLRGTLFWWILVD